MISINIELPDSLYDAIKIFSAEKRMSINQFMTLAAAEKISALRTIDQLREIAGKADFAEFEAFLAAVPDVEPEPEDAF